VREGWEQVQTLAKGSEAAEDDGDDEVESEEGMSVGDWALGLLGKEEGKREGEEERERRSDELDAFLIVPSPPSLVLQV